jgi:site-specific recombinase XerC
MAAIRMLFSWLTEKGVLGINPAREVKTERFSRAEGKTPAFVEGEVQQLLDVIEASTDTCLRDRAGYRTSRRADCCNARTCLNLPIQALASISVNS